MQQAQPTATDDSAATFRFFWFSCTTMMFFGVFYVLWFGFCLLHVHGFQAQHPYPSGWRLSAAQAGPPSTHSITTLEEGTLYTLTADFNSVVNNVAVNHTKKHLVATKVSMVPFSKNPFNVDDVNQLFASFALYSGIGRLYKLIIMGINDMSMPDPTGLLFVWKNRTESLMWWQNETRTNSPFAWPNSLRMEVYLARIPAFDMPAFELPGEKGKRKKK